CCPSSSSKRLDPKIAALYNSFAKRNTATCSATPSESFIRKGRSNVLNGPGSLIWIVSAISVLILASTGVWVLFKFARLLDRVNERLDTLGGLAGVPVAEEASPASAAAPGEPGPAHAKAVPGFPIAHACQACGKRYNLPKPGTYTCKCGAQMIV